MKLTRIVVGFAVWILLMGPFLTLGKLSYDIRGFNLFATFRNADVEIPATTRLLWAFGPLDWWAFLTPVFLAVAAAAALRSPFSVKTLAWLLGASVIQFTAITASVLPYYKMTSVMGYPLPAPYPTQPLFCNVSLLGASIALAAWSVSTAAKWKQTPLTIPQATSRRGS